MRIHRLNPGMARAEEVSDFTRETPVEERSRPRTTRILAGAGLGSLAAVAGGVGGYELSQSAVPTSALPKRVRLQPLLSFSHQGAQMGLGGVF